MSRGVICAWLGMRGVCQQTSPRSLLTSPVRAVPACPLSFLIRSYLTAACSRPASGLLNRLLADGGSDVEECAIPASGLFLGSSFLESIRPPC